VHILEGVFALEVAVVAFALFLIGVLRDPRSFGNAVLLGLALALGALGVAEHLARMPGRPERLLLLALVLAVALGPFIVACYLLATGVTMARRESLRAGNLLSLAAGVVILAVLALNIVADRIGSPKLGLLATASGLVFGYLSFLLISFCLYAWVYGQVAALVTRADYVIVLGAGLGRRGQVTPLLASRLDRGHEVWSAIAARAASRGGSPDALPALIVSGGKGSDEVMPEAEAMARYLTARGFPAGRLIREERSRTTEENLKFSKAIMEAITPAGSPSAAGQASCVIVTSGYHVLRAAIIARGAGLRGQVTGARTAGYYWPSAMLREFGAVFLRYRVVNLGICAILAFVPVALAVVGRLRPYM
jgi:uncharacterized SAM-binding protein YcdF (DUF218 family)